MWLKPEIQGKYVGWNHARKICPNIAVFFEIMGPRSSHRNRGNYTGITWPQIEEVIEKAKAGKET